MKQTLLTLCICAAFSSSAFAQSQTAVDTTQRWPDTTRFVEGQPGSRAQTQSPALMTDSGRPGALNPALLQQMQNQQSQEQQLQAQQAQQNVAEGQTQQPQEDPSLDRPPVEDMEAKRLMWALDPVQNLRQEGGRMERPNARGFSSSAQSSDRLRVAEWKRHLLNLGIPESKIEFEARRLNRDEFEMWASKFVWWESDEHPNIIDVTH